MCRLLIFKGEPIGLSHLITKPSQSVQYLHSHLTTDVYSDTLPFNYSSIINQAFDCRLRLDAGPINADGFGVGWYDTELEDSVPCVFQAITPAWFLPRKFWYEKSVLTLIEWRTYLHSSAHVRASTTGALSEENCHPWIYGSLLWMHNGNISGFNKIKRLLQAELSDEFFHFPQGKTKQLLLNPSVFFIIINTNKIHVKLLLNIGSTDSEWAFALFLNELSKVTDARAGNFPYMVLKETMIKTIEKLKSWWISTGEVEPSRMNFAVTDGRSVVATKYHKFDKREKIVLIASEPLTFEKTDWIEIACQTLIVVTPKMNVLQFPIIDELLIIHPISAKMCAQKLPLELSKSISRPTPTNIDMAKLLQLALNSVLLIMFLVGTSSSAPDYSKHNCRTMADHPVSAQICAQKLPPELSKVYIRYLPRRCLIHLLTDPTCPHLTDLCLFFLQRSQSADPYEYRHGQIIATRSELRPLDHFPRRYIILRPRLFITVDPRRATRL
ncbi:hypothetical protein PSHT_10634 [Puccinia striiformis]|uniref:Glutamine amidotransferase type-2 domain-containing protein n=1 Tax=Puccinia striiformis TaxID=27350 RepID=A0A2S4V8I4_9BASI|nr:hypothetical protein PSHT_10634 [Puccinia striiformis]